MRVAIHQPEFAPWLGFFDKAARADHLLLLDDVQFRKNYFQNRNRVLGSAGPTWLTVPVKHSSDSRIDEVLIAHDVKPPWKARIAGILDDAYAAAEHRATTRAAFLGILEKASERLVDLNVAVLRWLMDAFDVRPRVSLASEYDVEGAKSDRVLELCRSVGATTYVSGVSGRGYLDLAAFERAGIAVEFQEFHHPIYPQLRPGFEPLMSAVEPVFLFGPKAGHLLTPSWTPRIGTVFT